MMRFKEILLVDDEQKVLKALKRELRGRVGVIHCASSADEALQILAENPVELVISDYKMPGRDGAELVIDIRRQYPYVMTIILSGQADLSGISRALNEGQLYRFIKKPWKIQQLLEAIKDSFREAETRHGLDCMTGLKNLLRLNQYVDQLRQQMEQLPIVVIVHISGVKAVNENYGFQTGNRLLCDIARHLYQDDDAQDLYRQGNNYLFLLPVDKHLYDRVQQLNQHIRSRHTFDREIEFCSSVHLMELPVQEEMTAGYLSERIHSHSFPFEGDSSLNIICEDPLTSDIYQLFAIQKGLQNDEFLAFYQPQWNIRQQRLEGMEALARWQNTKGNVFSPVNFFSVLDKYNIIELLTEKILQCVVVFIEENNALLENLHISINVPGRMLIDGEFFELLEKCTKLDKQLISKLSVEITEQDCIDNFARAKSELKRLKSLGISCALDDFGTGYAGYEYLYEMPFDVLKIDGRFVQSIGEHQATNVVLQSMIDSARTLNMKVIAEWVETQEQVDLLRKLGCSVIQGHLVGEALSPEALVEYLSK
ncbi:Phytochrome-like protein cph2 [Vibrio aerogenes CECT 7868]|uniref:Phytochrome-like protein cph2 n=1 Tax=Vibrio aerogenes CECT 7868 TaxID=1216006 RepID=A0A1M6CB92_9VIBR|nr:EAL domain-containing protein [Vibrio aerogenes]SHI57988.1 Phytochrome-like protein cph2 [Vibrio aerogenes CECT 7868]